MYSVHVETNQPRRTTVKSKTYKAIDGGIAMISIITDEMFKIVKGSA